MTFVGRRLHAAGTIFMKRRLQCASQRRRIATEAQENERQLKQIRSLLNPTVKHCVKVRIDPKYRQKHNTAIVSGIVPIQELSVQVTNLQIQSLLWDESFLANQSPDALIPGIVRGQEEYSVTPQILQKVAGTKSAEGLKAVAEVVLPKQINFSSCERGSLSRLLVLDGIQDPGNLGTLMRTALALGWQGVYFLPGCCEPYNEKALRAGRGASFKLAQQQGSFKELKDIIQHHGLKLLSAKAADSTVPSSAACGEHEHSLKRLEAMGIALVLGNEGAGVSREISDTSTAISIPMPGQMESLNVSQAGAILLFSLSKSLALYLQQLGGLAN